MKKKDIANYIDHTLLKADTTREELVKLCSEAKENKFYSVCVNPSNVVDSKKLLDGTSVKVCTVIGFPLGQITSESKSFETKEAIFLGAEEIDMVINIGKLKDKDYEYVREDIESVVLAAGDKLVKAIVETSLLTKEEIIKACELASLAGADFVKTSTGFAKSGATKEDIKLMKKTVGDKMGIKASGGIRTYMDAITMIESGATRIGASSSVAIINDAK
ncbi:MAG: deoxyribose-phosphate aldolase [Clostridium sp.]|nr:deoxyribose-phosphate aldolase [Clostridium sp.]